MESYRMHADPPSFPVAVKFGYDYEVFLSFRGPDTRKTFTDHLYNDLLKAGIRTFRDSEELQVGQRIGDMLLEAVNQSKISIPIFSKDYASSDWCLIELAQMVECRRSNKKDHTIIPVFLDVTPSEVRNQTGRYYQAFQDLEKNFTAVDVQKWRKALQTVGDLKGFDLQMTQGYEGMLSKMVVSEVIKVLKRQYLDVPLESLFGIESHVDAILNMVDIHNKDQVRVVGIWGMGGAGKTTIAKLVYNQLIPQFDYCSFINEVREKSKPKKGLKSLQKQLISDLTRYNHEDISNIDSGKYMLKDRFLHKKVLILLDDMDRAELLEHLIPNVHSIAPGSRIIITTRDMGVLYEHQVKLIHQVTEMNPDDAFLLFCKRAFWQDYPVAAKFVNLSFQMLKVVGGLPLAIKQLGSDLSYYTQEDIWFEELQRWRKQSVIEQRLMVSFDALDRGTKEIFLDIACLFNGMDSRILVHMWKACRFSPVSSIYDLMRKSLITVGEDHKIRMHNQLRYLGRGIVIAENSTPGSRSRLWCSQDGFEVLCKQEGTERLKAICLEIDKEEGEEEEQGAPLGGVMFKKMSNLEYLGLGSANLTGGQFKGCLLRLKWLSWHGDTVLNIPSDLHLKNLVVLDLSDSSIRESWNGWASIKAAKKLQVLNLSRCYLLATTPDFTLFPPLKRLILEECGALATVDPSIGQLKVLESLNLKNCLELKRLPQELGSLKELTELIFDGTSIQEMGGIYSEMRNLETLSCTFCKSLTQLPNSIQFLVKLRWLFLDHCESLTRIPTSILQLVSLEELHLSHTLVELLPDSIDTLSNLKVLDISHSQIRNLPPSLGNLKKLEVINASKCHQLEGEISLGCTSPCFRRLSFNGCTRISKISASIERLSNLQTLDIEGCECLEDLPSLPSGLVNIKLTLRSSMVVQNLCSLINLTELKLVQCMNLTGIPKEVEKLTKLQKLKIHLTNIRTFPEEIVKLGQLRQLSIQECNKLESLPQLPSSLREVHIVGCSSLGGLPRLSNLKKMVSFGLLECPHVSHIPDLYDLLSLKTLKLRCNMIGSYTLKRLSSLSDLFLEGDGLFKSLNFGKQKGIHSIEVVDCGTLTKVEGLSSLCVLKSVRISNCKRLTEIEGVHGLVSLEKLDISGCEAIQELEDVSKLQNLKELNLSGCIGLKREILGLAQLQSLERLDISECCSLPAVHHPRAEIIT